MTGQVMVHATGERVFLRRAAAQQQQPDDTAYRHNYVGSSLHFFVGLCYNNSVRPKLFRHVIPFAGFDEQLLLGGIGQGRAHLDGGGVGAGRERLQQ